MFSLMHKFNSKCAWIWSVKCIFVVVALQCTISSSAVYLNIKHVPVRRFNYDYLSAAVPFSRFSEHIPQEQNVPLKHSSVSRDVFYIEPSDALPKIKWSLPAVEHRHTDLSRYEKAPSSKDDHFAFSSYSPYVDNHDIQISSTKTYSANQFEAHLVRNTLNNVLKNHGEIDINSTGIPATVEPHTEPPVFKPELHLSLNNFTDSNDSHALVPSNAVFDSQSSVMLKDEAPPHPDSPLQGFDGKAAETDLSSYDSVTTFSPVYDRDMLEQETNLRKWLSVTVSPDLFETTTSYHFSSSNGFMNRVDNVASSVPTEDNTGVVLPDVLPSVESTTSIRLGSGAVAGIVIAVLVCVTVITSTVIYLLYRRYNGKCTNVVEGKFNSDNCGYLDDSLRSSVYLNNHIELPKENSEEMSSLDNDSFLNSLETMTIQNYWADNTKNTKV